MAASATLADCSSSVSDLAVRRADNNAVFQAGIFQPAPEIVRKASPDVKIVGLRADLVEDHIGPGEQGLGHVARSERSGMEVQAGALSQQIARVAAVANDRAENIGARRLQTVMATLLEEVLFELPESNIQEVEFDGEQVRAKLQEILADEDLTRYIL